MKAVIKLDVPDWQIGQEVTVYFKDTMMKKGLCEMELSTDAEKIEKALRLCISSKNRCNSCPYVKEHNCNLSMIEDAMKLLKRKQQIVRCKDCRKRKTADCPCECADSAFSWTPDDDWYCADGEAKDDG